MYVGAPSREEVLESASSARRLLLEAGLGSDSWQCGRAGEGGRGV
jgi:hypothetical protein